MFLAIYSDVYEKLFTRKIARVAFYSEYILKIANKLE